MRYSFEIMVGGNILYREGGGLWAKFAQVVVRITQLRRYNNPVHVKRKLFVTVHLDCINKNIMCLAYLLTPPGVMPATASSNAGITCYYRVIINDIRQR
jgi:hypothetical protein